MDIREIQDILNKDIEDLSRIRDNLSDKGEPLDRETKNTIRRQLSMNWLDDMHSDAAHLFARGDVKGFEESIEYITDVMRKLS